MKKEIHILIAKTHFRLAEEVHKEYEQAEEDNRTAFRCVAAQNYFYSAINIMEAILAEKELHSFSHENRARKLLENSELFSDEIIELFDQVDRNIRNKVAYRGENGEKYKLLRRFAALMIEQTK